MVLLAKGDITTQEVFDWQGIHLLHFAGSTCSKKIRIFLELKQVDWVSHHVNLVKRENNSDWFMGINPRGLVPVLVHDGQVHIESNDILEYLEQLYPTPPLIPAADSTDMAELLKIEDDLHVDLRNLTLRFTAPSKLMQRSVEQLEQYDSAGTGTVNGEPDHHKLEELEYWRQFAANKGITNAQVIESCARFKAALDDLDQRLESSNYLLGDELSLADVSWFVSITRIMLAGYPLQRLHPGMWAWLQLLLAIPAFAGEAKPPFMQAVSASVIGLVNAVKRSRLDDIARL